MKKIFSVLPACLFFTLTVLGLTFVSCDNTSAGISGNPCRIIYHTGEGQGAAPFPQTVAEGTLIELPGQENMTHPENKTLSGWRSSQGGGVYSPYQRYIVNSSVEFTAQWAFR